MLPATKSASRMLVELLGNDNKACSLALNGKVALAEMPGEVRKSTPEARVQEDARIRGAVALAPLENLDTGEIAEAMRHVHEYEKHAL
jgi:hypothetical protein